MPNEQTTDFQRLSSAEKARVKLVIDSVVDMLNEYADMMERGDLESMSGPEALRWVALDINAALIKKETNDAE